MDLIRNIDNTRNKLADIYVGENDRIEKLRLVMEQKLGRPVERKEAETFANDFVTFYRTLAQGKRVIIGGKDE